MKRIVRLGLLFCLLAGLSVFSSIAAPNPDAGIYSMAQYFPATTEAFLVTRIDEAFIEDLDTLSSTIMAGFTDFGIPNMSLTQAAQFATGMDVDEILGWLGDYAAVAQYPASQEMFDGYVPSEYSVVLLLEDPAAADAFLTEVLTDMSREEDGEHIIFSDGFFKFVMTPTTLTYYFSEEAPSLEDGTLLDSDKYRSAISELPLDDYSAGLYVDLETMVTGQMPQADMEIMDMNLGGYAIGFTSLDDNTLIADIVHAPLEYTEYDGSGRVDAGFLANIPDSMSSVVVGSDLSHVITTSINEMNNIDERMDGELGMPDVNEPFAELGIDLQADILDWLTGDYAIFSHVDTIPIVKDAMAYEFNLNGRVDFGVMADASADPEAAQRLAGRLGELLAQALDDSDFTMRQDVIAGTDVTIISIATQIDNPFVTVECEQEPVKSPLTYELVLGANDEVFVFATRPLADTLLAGDYDGIDSTEAYQSATQYFLPDPTSIWYVDGEGFLYSLGVNPVSFLMLAGPQIGCIYSSIIAQLETGEEATPTPSPTPPPTATPDFQQIDQQVQPLEFAQSLVESASITSTIKDNGVIQVRFALTYNP